MDVLAALSQAPEGLTAWGKLITAVGQHLKVGTVDTQQPKYPTKLKINRLYHIEGNFGMVFNLANWQFCGKSPNLKPTNIISYTIALCGSARDRQIKNSSMHSDD